MTTGPLVPVTEGQLGDKTTRCIERALIPYLLGVIQSTLVDPYTYNGDSEDIAETVLQFQLLMSELAAETSGCNMVGQIVAGVFNAIPDNMLLCDGAEYDCADYPELCAVIDSAFISGDVFNVPDLRDRAVIGSSTNHPQNSTGGAEEHTLTNDELPSHYHPMNATLTILGHGGFTPVLDVISGTGGTTNLFGGGQAHNNMPPFMALRYYLIAR